MKKMRYECQWDPALVDNYNNVNTIKAEIRKGNWTYMSRHPEVKEDLVLTVRFLHLCSSLDLLSNTDQGHNTGLDT